MSYKRLCMPIIFILLGHFVSATILSDGGESHEEHWRVYDNTPAGSTITIQDERGELAVSLKGQGRSNSFLLGAKRKSSAEAWKISDEFLFSWKMKTQEKYRITIYVSTTKGKRKFNITHRNKNRGLYKKYYIGLGLGKQSMSGGWQQFSLNLERELKKYEPDNQLLLVNGMQFRGSTLLDDVKLTKEDVVEPIEIALYADGICNQSEEANNPKIDVVCNDGNHDNIKEAFVLDKTEHKLFLVENQKITLEKSVAAGDKPSKLLGNDDDESYTAAYYNGQNYTFYLFGEDNQIKEVLKHPIAQNTNITKLYIAQRNSDIWQIYLEYTDQESGKSYRDTYTSTWFTLPYRLESHKEI